MTDGNEKTQYMAVPGSGTSDKEAQLIGEAIEAIIAEHGLLPEDELADKLIDYARPVESPLHHMITWDEEKAAQAYREMQAEEVFDEMGYIKGPDGSWHPPGPTGLVAEEAEE